MLAQIEVDVYYNEIIAHKSEGEWNKIAPLRILSFDIECQGRKGQFPEAERDPVIQISNAVSVYGGNQPPIVQVCLDCTCIREYDLWLLTVATEQNVFTLKGCLPIVGAQVITSENEEDMLMKWRLFLEKCDPDIITGYNVQVGQRQLVQCSTKSELG